MGVTASFFSIYLNMVHSDHRMYRWPFSLQSKLSSTTQSLLIAADPSNYVLRPALRVTRQGINQTNNIRQCIDEHRQLHWAEIPITITLDHGGLFHEKSFM